MLCARRLGIIWDTESEQSTHKYTCSSASKLFSFFKVGPSLSLALSLSLSLSLTLSLSLSLVYPSPTTHMPPPQDIIPNKVRTAPTIFGPRLWWWCSGGGDANVGSGPHFVPRHQPGLTDGARGYVPVRGAADGSLARERVGGEVYVRGVSVGVLFWVVGHRRAVFRALGLQNCLSPKIIR